MALFLKSSMSLYIMKINENARPGVDSKATMVGNHGGIQCVVLFAPSHNSLSSATRVQIVPVVRSNLVIPVQIFHVVRSNLVIPLTQGTRAEAKPM